MFAWLKRFMPVFRGTMEDALIKERASCEERLRSLRQRHREDMEKTERIASEVVSRLSHIEFLPNADASYTMHLRFSPRLVHCGMDNQFVGKMLGRQVEQEIATSRYIESAYDTEMEMMKEHYESRRVRYRDR